MVTASILYALKREGARVRLFARNVAKAAKMGEEFGVSVEPIEAFGASDAEIVVNATPVGMRGHSAGTSPVPPPTLRGRLVAYDLVYNPLATRFLADAAAGGCRTISGLDMLVSQAALQFELWTGIRPPVNAMHNAAAAVVATDR